MKERTKEIVRDGFGSLVSNAAALRGAKSGPFWLTLVMFILSLLLPIIPIFVTQANTKGSSFLGSNSYSLEKYLPSIGLDLKKQGYELHVTEEHQLEVYKDDKNIPLTDYTTSAPFAVYENQVSKQYDFVVYVSNETGSKEKKAFNTAVSGTKYTLNTTTKSEEKDGVYTPSYMILFRNSIYVVIYAKDSTTAVTGSYMGDYKTIKATNAGLSEFLKVTDKDGKEITANIYDNNYTDGVFKNFKKVMDRSYDTLKIQNMWGTSGIYLGIFAGLSIVMGFIMWILTRGKNNPNNYFTPWLTQKVEARLALAPGLITLILGFFLPQYIPIAFIITLGLRVMWISMKELRPLQN